MANRKAVEAYILKSLTDLLPDGSNTERYKTLFKDMSDRDFKEMMEELRDGKITLSILAHNGGPVKFNSARLLKKDKDYGVKFFQKLTYTDGDVKGYTSPIPTLVILMPVRRQIQTTSKGVAVPENSKSIDLLTGQVTGVSASSKMTMPEIQLLSAAGLDKTLVEILKYRGGDLGGNNALNAALFKYGEVDQELLSKHATGVEVNKTVNAIFAAMHIKSNL